MLLLHSHGRPVRSRTSMPLHGRDDLLHQDFPVLRVRYVTRNDEEDEMDQPVLGRVSVFVSEPSPVFGLQ